MYYPKIMGIMNEQVDSMLRSWMAGDITEEEVLTYLMAWEKWVVARMFVNAIKVVVFKEMDHHGYEGGLEEFQQRLGEYPEVARSVMEADGLLNRYLNGVIDQNEFIAEAEQVDPKVLSCILASLADIMRSILAPKAAGGHTGQIFGSSPVEPKQP